MARPNVLFEAGMAFASQPKQAVFAQIGEVRPFTGLSGLHVVHLSGPPSRREFAAKLKNAGCQVNLEGTRWLSLGEFEAAEGGSRRRRRR